MFKKVLSTTDQEWLCMTATEILGDSPHNIFALWLVVFGVPLSCTITMFWYVNLCWIEVCRGCVIYVSTYLYLARHRARSTTVEPFVLFWWNRLMRKCALLSYVATLLAEHKRSATFAEAYRWKCKSKPVPKTCARKKILAKRSARARRAVFERHPMFDIVVCW